MTPYYERDGICIYVGDNSEILPHLDPNSISAVVTDPPSGISFMNANWDSHKGGRNQWIAWLASVLSECKRVMLPGAHAFVWALPRTSGWTSMAIEDAGLDVRDCVTHLFGSGFPKSHNLDGDWQGWGTALKPAAEFWYLARKPFRGTVAANVMEHGTGALNIDASRIGFASDADKATVQGATWSATPNDVLGQFHATPARLSGADSTPDKGRWPANVVLDEDAAAALDAQSGVSTSDNRPRLSGTTFATGVKRADLRKGHSDTGGASRFMKVVEQDDLPINQPGASRMAYHAKASRRERNAGLDGMPEHPSYMVENGSKTAGAANGKRYDRHTVHQNNHPTVKPLALMRYLIRMVTPPEGIVLDPFMGSGSTLVAAAELGFHAIGIELSEEYAEIAARRVDHALNERAIRLPGLEDAT